MHETQNKFGSNDRNKDLPILAKLKDRLFTMLTVQVLPNSGVCEKLRTS